MEHIQELQKLSSDISTTIYSLETDPNVSVFRAADQQLKRFTATLHNLALEVKILEEYEDDSKDDLISALQKHQAEKDKFQQQLRDLRANNSRLDAVDNPNTNIHKRNSRFGQERGLCHNTFDSDHIKLGANMLRYISRDWKQNRIGKYEQDQERLMILVPSILKPDPVDVDRNKFVLNRISMLMKHVQDVMEISQVCH
jgi:hypothetical protein